MKKTINTKTTLVIYGILSQAKYTKMEDNDKIKIWKIHRALKPVATKFEDDSKDASEKLKPYDDYDSKLQKAQEYERLKANKQPTIDIMTDAEYNSFIDDFKKYNKTVNDAVSEFAEKEIEFEFEPISEEAFGKLMASNEWNMDQVTKVSEFVLE